MSFKGLHAVPIFSSLDLHLKVVIYANNSLIPMNFYRVRLEETLQS